MFSISFKIMCKLNECKWTAEKYAAEGFKMDFLVFFNSINWRQEGCRWLNAWKLLQRMSKWATVMATRHTSTGIAAITSSQPTNLTQSNKWAKICNFIQKEFHILRFKLCHRPLSSPSSSLSFSLRYHEKNVEKVRFAFLCLQIRWKHTFKMKQFGFAQVSCYHDDDDDDDDGEDMANCCDNKIENPLYLHCELGKME